MSQLGWVRLAHFDTSNISHLFLSFFFVTSYFFWHLLLLSLGVYTHWGVNQTFFLNDHDFWTLIYFQHSSNTFFFISLLSLHSSTTSIDHPFLFYSYLSLDVKWALDVQIYLLLIYRNFGIYSVSTSLFFF